MLVSSENAGRFQLWPDHPSITSWLTLIYWHAIPRNRAGTGASVKVLSAQARPQMTP
jgi:hypothetical protein